MKRLDPVITGGNGISDIFHITGSIDNVIQLHNAVNSAGIITVLVL